MLKPNDFDPKLIWARIKNHASKHVEGLKDTDLKLLIYSASKKGTWLLLGPKLYWQDDLNGTYYINCNQNDLLTNREILADTILIYKRTRNTELLGKTFEKAMIKLSEED